MPSFALYVTHGFIKLIVRALGVGYERKFHRQRLYLGLNSFYIVLIDVARPVNIGGIRVIFEILTRKEENRQKESNDWLVFLHIIFYYLMQN